jgi:hypothetical protein
MGKGETTRRAQRITAPVHERLSVHVCVLNGASIAKRPLRERRYESRDTRGSPPDIPSRTGNDPASSRYEIAAAKETLWEEQLQLCERQ